MLNTHNQMVFDESFCFSYAFLIAIETSQKCDEPVELESWTTWYEHFQTFRISRNFIQSVDVIVTLEKGSDKPVQKTFSSVYEHR